MSADQGQLFEPPQLHRQGPPPEKEGRDARRTRTQKETLAMGVHPATRARLLSAEWGYTCGDCAHVRAAPLSRRTVFKCQLHRLGPSHSEASDIRLWWPACTRFRIDQPVNQPERRTP